MGSGYVTTNMAKPSNIPASTYQAAYNLRILDQALLEYCYLVTAG